MSIEGARNIIASVTHLTDNPFVDTGFVFDGWEYLSPSIPVPVMPIPNVVIIDIPGYEPITITPPAPISGDPTPAAYSATAALVNFVETPFPVLPDYATPVTLGEITYSNYGAPPVDYPVDDLIEPDDGAGLSPISFYAPELVDRPTFIEIKVAPYSFNELELFSEEIPDYDPLSDPEFIELDEYKPSTIADGFLDTLEEVLTGQATTITGKNQAALVAQKLEGLDRDVMREETAIFAKVAAKGFSLPNPELITGVVALADDASRKRGKANREAFDEIMEEHKQTTQNYSFEALEGALAIEKAQVALYLGYLDRSTKATRINVKMASILYDSLVKMFNEKIRGLDFLVDDYNSYVRAVKNQTSVYGDQASAEDAKARGEQGKLTAYSGQIEVVRAIAKSEQLKTEESANPIEEYSSSLRSLMANADIVRNNVRAYGDAISAYSKAVEGQSGLVDGYTAEIDAAMSANSVVESNFKATGDCFRVESARSRAYEVQVGGWSSVLGGLIQEYKEYTQAQRNYIQTLTSKVGAEVSQNATYIQGINGVSGYASSWNRAAVEATGAKNSYNIALAESVTRQQALVNQAAAANARIEAGFLGAKAKAAGSQTQAAYGVTSGTMRISGSVSSDNGTSDNSSSSWQTSGKRSYGLSRSQSVEE